MNATQHPVNRPLPIAMLLFSLAGLPVMPIPTDRVVLNADCTSLPL